MSKIKVLVIGQLLDGHEVGESMTAFKMLRELAKMVDLTVLAMECNKGPPLREQLTNAEVVTWREPAWMRKHERLGAMLKMNTLFLGRKARAWIRAALESGRRWDLAHQLLPRAPRYSTVLRKFPMPYLIGPVGGALPNPAGFEDEMTSEAWFTRLRALDPLRFRYDPWLRASYSQAEIVLGVAPYIRETLRDVPIKRFDSALGIGVDDVVANPPRRDTTGTLRLLHVGRAVRSKGLRDAVRAMSHLKDLDVTLTSVGDGDELPHCKQLAAELGVADRITFLGKLPRAAIEKQYENSDLFLFPSFRESMGGVLFEAMRWALPVITVRAGGPDWIVSDDCGLKVDVTDPETLAKDLAAAVRTLHADPALRQKLGEGARAKLQAEQVWPVKAQKMYGVYTRLLEELRSERPAPAGAAAGQPDRPGTAA